MSITIFDKAKLRDLCMVTACASIKSNRVCEYETFFYSQDLEIDMTEKILSVRNDSQ